MGGCGGVLTDNAVVNDVFLVDERQTATDFRIEQVHGGGSRQVGRVGRSVGADNTVTLLGLPKRQLGQTVPVVDFGVVGHRIGTC